MEYLYDLRHIDLLMIRRGYDRRYRQQWGATRWGTYNLMCSFLGSDALKKGGIHSPQDLLPFPWEKMSADKTQRVTQEDRNYLRDLMHSMTI